MSTKVYTSFSFIGALGLLMVSAASAATITVTAGGTPLAGEGLISSQAGATTVNFNTGTAPANFALSGTAAVVQGTSANYAAPTGDSSFYLSTGLSSVVITPTTTSRYFGLYIGSLDSYNSLSIVASDGTTTSYTGTQLSALLSAGLTTSVYANFLLSGANINSVTLSSTQYAFESDNEAFANPAAVTPEPATFALLFGGLGIGAILKRKSLMK